MYSSVDSRGRPGPERWLTPRRAALLSWGALACVLVALQGGAVLENVRHTLGPFRINNDAQQQIFPFYRYLTPTAFAGDYIANYYLACYPVGYWALYAGP